MNTLNKVIEQGSANTATMSIHASAFYVRLFVASDKQINKISVLLCLFFLSFQTLQLYGHISGVAKDGDTRSGISRYNPS